MRAGLALLTAAAAGLRTIDRSALRGAMHAPSPLHLRAASTPTPSLRVPSAPTMSEARRIFCNRALNVDKLQTIGFDLDYTLAEYKREFDLLAYRGAIKKLLAMGYPADVEGFQYSPDQYQRGLLIDKKRGNLLKLDRHKYVKVAYHGLAKLESEQRKALYERRDAQQPTFSPPEFASVDTEFLIVDVCLYCQLVALKDRMPSLVPQSYARLYQDVRRAVDLCHCDGEIKDPVALEPSRYIEPSPELAQMLTQLRLGGKQVRPCARERRARGTGGRRGAASGAPLPPPRVRCDATARASRATRTRAPSAPRAPCAAVSRPTAPGTPLTPASPRRCSAPRVARWQVFLLTNSLFDYTQVVCNYLLGEDWLDYFDLVICGARKPGFLLDPYLPLFQVRADRAAAPSLPRRRRDRAATRSWC